MSDKIISVKKFIPASPEKIFDLLADPKMHPVLDGSGTVQKPRGDNPERLSLGATFGMEMKLGTRYPIQNTVVEFEEGRKIAWCHFARNIWRYELEPAEGGTLVTESFDWSQGRAPGVGLRLAGFFRRNKAGMEKTLENLERHLAGTA